MAFANFFDKIALNASQVLKHYDRSGFEKILNDSLPTIVFGRNATSTQQGKAALDLTVRLSARLYPKIRLINTSGSKQFEKNLKELSLSINPDIEILDEGIATVYLVAGQVDFDCSDVPSYYIGSNSWHSNFSSSHCLKFGSSDIIFGAGAAACFGMANVFRKIFEGKLPYGKVDSDFSFSIIDSSKGEIEIGSDTKIENIDIGKLHLVGVGAVGNAFLWSLKNSKSISGQIRVIDDEQIDLSNLQRYVLTEQNSIGQSKVDFAKDVMTGSSFKLLKSKMNWQHFISKNASLNIEKVAVCVDSAEDRISIQSSLPKKIFNAWTQQESIGISRHFNFDETACLSCLYFPTRKKTSRSEEVANSFGIPEHERLVRTYLATSKPIDEVLINLVCQANNIEAEQFGDFIGKPVELFYSKAICGGVMMRLTGSGSAATQHSLEVPLAFESALAGILLAAEVVIECQALREGAFPIISQINLLRPLSNYIKEDQKKHHSKRCICQDEMFVKEYLRRWN